MITLLTKFQPYLELALLIHSACVCLAMDAKLTTLFCNSNHNRDSKNVIAHPTSSFFFSWRYWGWDLEAPMGMKRFFSCIIVAQNVNTNERQSNSPHSLRQIQRRYKCKEFSWFLIGDCRGRVRLETLVPKYSLPGKVGL